MKSQHIAILLPLLLAMCITTSPAAETKAPTLQQLADLSASDLSRIDIALLNLRCAEGLPGAFDLDTTAASEKLDLWADRIDSETNRYLPLYHQNPAKFHNMEGYFRMQMLITVVMQDFGCRYNPARDTKPDDPEPADSFYADAEDVFLSGFLGDDPMGTCASFPVLYVALGRRLGYPLKLVTAKSHLFCRWDDEVTGERFNVEGTNSGMSSHPDSYYKNWPVPMSDEEIEANGHLRSLSPKEELAVFLGIRGICLRVHGRHREAAEASLMASQLAPDNDFYRRLHESFALNISAITKQ